MAIDGYLQWNTRILRRAPLLGGHTLSDSIPVYAVAPPPAGSSLPLLRGGAVHQRTPAFAHLALDQAGEVLALTIDGGDEQDFWRLKRLQALAQLAPVPFVVDDPREDVWTIPAAPRTLWPLSRPLPYPSLDPAEVPPSGPGLPIVPGKPLLSSRSPFWQLGHF